jgi:hypothetical protein
VSAVRFLAVAWGAVAMIGLLAAAGLGGGHGGGEFVVWSAAAQPPAEPAEPARHRAAVRAEELFFRALNHDAALRPEAIDALTQAFVADPADGATSLWLGMAHLWVVAESAGEPWTLLDRSVLARHYLARAAELRPQDTRIPSWLSAIELFIAGLEHDGPGATAAEADLARAFEHDPTFHAVSMGIIRWDNPPESSAFAESLRAMRLAIDGAADDPSALNMPRWPHNVEGFMLAMADYELKAGSRQRAAVMLNALRERPGYEAWPYKHLVEDRLENLHALARRFADDDPANDPPYILDRASGVSCVVCHQSGKEG